jgi:DNA-binding transcriptional regulator YhcF (GntR family)
LKSSDGFVRAKNNNGAVINTDNAALQAYKAKKRSSQDIDVIKQQVASLSSEMHQIKSLLTSIAEKLNK